MKTITFQGTEEQVKNLNFALDISSNSLPQKVETRVYVIDTLNLEKRDWNKLTDDEFMSIAEKEGNVYTLEGFTEAFNSAYVNGEIDKIRFINVPIS